MSHGKSDILEQAPSNNSKEPTVSTKVNVRTNVTTEESCDQKALHSEALLQALAQHHTAAHHRGKTVIKRHYTA
ncbi:hypothetical protein ACFX2H_032867 [Malus domestica]